MHGVYLADQLFLQTIVISLYRISLSVRFSTQKCSPFHANSNCYLLDLIDPQAFVFEIKHIDAFSSMAQ